MARYEPHNPGQGAPPPKKVVAMKRDEHGNLVPLFPERATKETTEAEERPQQADDPRPAAWRNVPPYGAGA